MHLLVHLLSLSLASEPIEEASTSPIRVGLATSGREGDAAAVLAALRAGLGRSALPLHEVEASCAAEDTECWVSSARRAEVTHLVVPVVSSHGPDIHLGLSVLDVAHGRTVTSARATCEICGEAELDQTARDLAASFAARLSRMSDARSVVRVEGAPAGAVIHVDGDRVGELPWTGELPPGPHRIRVSAPGYAPLEREVRTSPGLTEAVEFALPESDLKFVQRRRRLQGIGGGLVAVGVASLGAGIGLLAIDGRPHRRTCPEGSQDGDGRCPNVYESTAGGAVATALGIGALAAGVGLLVRAHLERRERERLAVRLEGRPGGLAVTF